MMISRLPVLWLMMALGMGLAVGQDSAELSARYREAAASAQADLDRALAELAVVRDNIAKEKPALALESEKISVELREARRQADLARTTRDAAEADEKRSEERLKAWRDEKQYIESLLLDFRKNYEAGLSLAQVRHQQDLLKQNDFSGRLALLEKATAQLESAGRVTVIPGEVVNPEGVLLPGRFAEVGPVTWFLADNNKHSGLVTTGVDLQPRLVEGTDSRAEIEKLLKGEAATLSFDPTRGTAVAMVEAGETFLEHIKSGGFWIYPILLLAVIALSAALWKWWQLSRIRPYAQSLVYEILQHIDCGDRAAAFAATAELKHPVRGILERGISVLDMSPRPSRDDLEEALYEPYLAAEQPLKRGLTFIAIASSTAPLLGLLGTVTGMIATFQLINIFGTGDAKSLASGISEALVTTEYGLIVAIPALIMHALLSRKIQGIKNSMESASLAFLNGAKLS
jgi:biopolymer transport protein ExbB